MTRKKIGDFFAVSLTVPGNEGMAYQAWDGGRRSRGYQQRGGCEVCRDAVGTDTGEPTRKSKGPPGIYGGVHTQ